MNNFKIGDKNSARNSISVFGGFGFVSCGYYFILIKFAAAVIILIFSALKLSFLSLYYCSDNMVLDITLKQTAFERPGSSVEKIEFWWCCFNCFFSYFKEETFTYFSAIEHIFACSLLTVNNSVCLSSYFHNFSKFYFIALPVRPPGVWSVSAPFVVGIYFFVKTLDSH